MTRRCPCRRPRPVRGRGPVRATGPDDGAARATGAASAEDGGASVEFALVLPALVLVLGVVVGSAAVAASAIRVADAAAVVARQVARGDATAAPGTLQALVPGATMTAAGSGDLRCVTVTLEVRAAGLPGAVPVTSRSCAPTAGR